MAQFFFWYIKRDYFMKNKRKRDTDSTTTDSNTNTNNNAGNKEILAVAQQPVNSTNWRAVGRGEKMSVAKAPS